MQVQSTVATQSVASCNLCGAPTSVPAPKKAKVAPEVVQLDRTNLKTLLLGQGDRFVSIDFVKLDGSVRTLTGRLGVKSYLKGGSNKVEADDRPYLTMFDSQLCQYRTVNLSTVSAVRASGKIYRVIG